MMRRAAWRAIDDARRADAMTVRIQRPSFKPPMWTKRRFKMFAWPRRWVRRIPPVS
jgi:hypothetical protein